MRVQTGVRTRYTGVGARPAALGPHRGRRAAPGRVRQPGAAASPGVLLGCCDLHIHQPWWFTLQPGNGCKRQGGSPQSAEGCRSPGRDGARPSSQHSGRLKQENPKVPPTLGHVVRGWDSSAGDRDPDGSTQAEPALVLLRHVAWDSVTALYSRLAARGKATVQPGGGGTCLTPALSEAEARGAQFKAQPGQLTELLSQNTKEELGL